MADPKDKLTPSSDAKLARSAAVKPPVLEGKARAAEATKPAPGKAEKPEQPEQPAKPEPKPPIRPAVEAPRYPGIGRAWLAGLAGGVLGLGGAYALAVLGYWPTQTPPAPPPPDPRIAQVSTAVPELQTIANTVQSELSVLTNRVAALETREPVGTGETSDLAPLAADIAALQERVDALVAAPAAQSDVSEDHIQSLATFESELDSLQQSAGSVASEITAMASRIAALETQQQARASGEENQARLPLILSGFEAAFAAGRSYDGELAALRQALPDLAVPETIAAGAMTGLKRPDAVIEAFNAVLPDMLAARPLDGEAGWQGATADWFRGVIALRPTGDVAGDGPEAVIARLEAALARRDFVAAQAEFSQLPEPMQAAGASVGIDIAAQAEAAAFLVALRQAALGAGGPA